MQQLKFYVVQLTLGLTIDHAWGTTRIRKKKSLWINTPTVRDVHPSREHILQDMHMIKSVNLIIIIIIKGLQSHNHHLKSHATGVDISNVLLHKKVQGCINSCVLHQMNPVVFSSWIISPHTQISPYNEPIKICSVKVDYKEVAK